MFGRSSVRLFSVFGIPIHIHISWLIIFVLITWSLAGQYFPTQYPRWSQGTCWTVGVVTSLLFFISVLLHELAHSVVARSRGMRVRDIVLFVFGGVSEIGDEPPSARTEFLMALVGPMMSFVIGICSFVLSLIARPISEPLSAVCFYLAWINILLGAFNLIPGFPLDGGRVLRSIIWGVTSDLQRATRWATRIGSVIAYLFIFLGIWQIFSNPRGGLISGIWYIFIGWFLNNAAQSSYSNVVIRNLLSGHAVREVANRDCPAIPAELHLDALVNEHILAQGRRCLPVVEGDRIVGLVTVHRVKEAPRDRWAEIRVADIMIPIERVKSIHPDTDLWTALQRMTEEDVNQLAVIEDGRLAGMLARDAVMGFLRIRAELAS